MKTFRITNGIDQMTDANLLLKGNVIHTSMTGNASFPTPSPTLIDLNNKINALQAAVEKAEGGNRQDIAEKNEIRQELIIMLHLLSNYVLFTSAGNEVVATSSGFKVSKLPTPRPAITAPTGLVLSSGVNKGDLELKFKRVAGATGYIFGITPSPLTPTSVWENSMNTISKKTYTGLDSAREYNCRVAAIGIREQLVYSGIVTRVTL